MSAVTESSGQASSSDPPPRMILLFGYWPPTDIGIEERPGILWAGRTRQHYKGYDILAVSATFREAQFGDWGPGEGDLPVDYLDTARDFWRIVKQHTPIAIMSFSLEVDIGSGWKLEGAARNLARVSWLPDSRGHVPPVGGGASDPSPYRNTRSRSGRSGSPPDPSRAAGSMRESNLPMTEISHAINQRFRNDTVRAFINTSGDVGAFVSEYMAYLVAWYRDYSLGVAYPNDPGRQCLKAGHTHVGSEVDPSDGETAAILQLEELIKSLPPASVETISA